MAESKLKQLAILGSGAMGQALCRGLLRAGVFGPEQVICADVDETKLAQLKEETRVSITTSNTEAAKSAAIVMIAVKPGIVDAVLEEISPVLSSEQLIITIAAGITIDHIQDRLPDGMPIVRAMPNTPSLIGMGATAYGLGKFARPEDADTAARIFSAVGIAVKVEERQLDAVTGLSGSGPAYIYLVIEALADAGVSVGIPRDAALKLAAQTALGSASMVIETGTHPAQLRELVTTPGGTTIAGLTALEHGKLRATLIDAVQAAAKRAQELSGRDRKS